MKELLHSKRFRKNLGKWLCMYFGVMGILATVVTYSKYITSKYVNSETRVAKFNLDISCVDSQTVNGNICKNGTVNPIIPNIYKFKVKNEFDVSTDLVLSIYVNNDFTIKQVKKNNNIESPEIKTTEITTANGKKVTKQVIKFIYSINANDGIINDEYSITVEYKGKDLTNEHTYNDLISVDYSAIQKD